MVTAMTDETMEPEREAERAGDRSYARPGEAIVDSRSCGAAGCANVSMTMFDTLQPGGSFVLVADHDPLPIRYMLDATRPTAAEWEPLTRGPELWHTRVRRVAAAAG